MSDVFKHPTLRVRRRLQDAALSHATMLALVWLAILGVAWARSDTIAHPWLAGWPVSIWMLAVAVISWGVNHFHRSARPTWILIATTSLPLLLFMVPVAKWLLEPTAGREPMELMLLASCRNGLLAMATIAATSRRHAVVAGVSLFLLTLASARIDFRLAALLLGTFATVGALWLCQSHGAAAATGFGRIAASIAVVVMMIVCCRVTVSVIDDRQDAEARTGLMPSSGGTDSSNDAATAGVGDGADEVAGTRNAKSIGFDQSNTFMNSERAGLYDAFLETFGAPAKTRDVVKMQMLRIQDIQAAQTTNTDDYRAGRQFSLTRQPPPPRAKASAHDSQALLYVQGSLPLHLRTNVFDHFDGQRWKQTTGGWPGWSLGATSLGPNWFAPVAIEQPWDWKTTRVPADLGPSPFTGDQMVRVRIGTLDTDALPLPADVQRVHLGRVTRLSLFEWKSPDVLRMTRRSVPQGTVIDAAYGTLDPALLNSWSWAAPLSTKSPEVAPEIQVLARKWTRGIDFGWGQVSAITRRLQTQYVLDPAFRPVDINAGDGGPLAQFLNRDHRGPDYMFASAAALMLKSLGYPARLAAGFYASEAAVDSQTGEAALSARDLHFWAEVLVGGRWAIVEATPGYSVALPNRPWQFAQFFALVRLMQHHAGVFALAGMFAFLALLNRTRLIDALATGHVWLRARENAMQHALRTSALLERRASLCGWTRPPAQTFGRWVAGLPPSLPVQNNEALRRLAQFATWAAYGPGDPSPWPAEEVRRVCVEVCRDLTASYLRRRLHRGESTGGLPI